MMKYKLFLFVSLLSFFGALGQTKNEREFKIKSSELPQNIEKLLSPYLKDAKRIRYYQEIDGAKKSFEAKFKKGRLHYSVEFDTHGLLEDVEFKINPADIPEASLANILQYLGQNFSRFSVKKIQQQYPALNKSTSTVLIEAFQNLILPYINYELIVSAKKEKGFEQFEVLFNAEGEFLSIRKSIRPKYDHVLY
ncbi:MAG: hypothetical protein AAGA43_03095 [Bacteroidota bacterium]